MYSQYIMVTPGSKVFGPYHEKRDCYEQLINFMKLHTHGKICALYGLRRTGKTVMMEQCIAELPEEEKQKSAYLLCLNGCDMLEIRRVMEPLYENGTRNFFIDEITAVTDFQKYGNVLSDYFSAKGAKVIIAGTDSLGIMLAESDILYDRIQMIHTSHVPYAEFSRLLGGKTLDDYIEYGGTLTKSPYKTLQASEEYQNTAIVGNILHSLEKSEDARRYGAALTELYDHDELQSVLNKMINKFSYFVTVQAVNKYFKSAPLYSTIHNIREPSYISRINVEEANQRTKDILGIKNQDEMDTSLSKQHIAELKDYLQGLDLFIKIPSYTSLQKGERVQDLEIFLQPGMIYAHATALMQSLADNSVWMDSCGIDDRKAFLFRADRFVKGILLENIILAETYRSFSQNDPKRFYVSQLSTTLKENNQHVEANMILVDMQKNESYLFEIKYSNQIVEEQTKHLRNEHFRQYVDENFGKVINRFVIYTGESHCSTNEIPYLNAETYLNELSQFSKPPYPKLEKLFSSEKVAQVKKVKKSSPKKPLL